MSRAAVLSLDDPHWQTSAKTFRLTLPADVHRLPQVLNFAVVPRTTSRALIGSALALLWLHVLLVLTLSSEHSRIVAVDFAEVAAAAVAAATCFVTARYSQGFARQFWWLVGGAMAWWGAAQGLWTVYDVLGTPDKSQLPTDVLFFFAFTPIALTLLLETEPERRHIDWQRTLDLIQFGIVLFAAYMYFFYLPTRIETPQDAVARRLGYLFNSRNAFLIVGCLLRATLSRSSQVRQLFTRLAAFMIVYSVSSAVANLARYWLH